MTILNPDPEEPDWRASTAVNLLVFCPFCAGALPASLRDEWFDTLEELGFDDPMQSDIPEEFRSDRWWKERGL